MFQIILLKAPSAEMWEGDWCCQNDPTHHPPLPALGNSPRIPFGIVPGRASLVKEGFLCMEYGLTQIKPCIHTQTTKVQAKIIKQTQKLKNNQIPVCSNSLTQKSLRSPKTENWNCKANLLKQQK